MLSPIGKEGDPEMWQKDIWVDVLEYLESPDCSEFSGSAAVAYHSP